jgi:putative PIN family toxin of toxin-antitoxin system
MEAIKHALTADEVVSCIQIEDEVIRIMHKKFLRTADSNRARLSSFLEGTTQITVSGKLSGICRDPKDDFILECAETAGADLIVTGDKDLLSLTNYGRIEIVTPRQYLDRAEDRPRDD